MGDGVTGPVFVMLHINGQLVHFQSEPQWMALQSTLSTCDRLPLPWHTAQLVGQPGQTQPAFHLSVLQQGGVNAMSSGVWSTSSSAMID